MKGGQCGCLPFFMQYGKQTGRKDNAIMRMKETPRARVGLYSAGLNTYWAQFEGLHDRIISYNQFIDERVSEWGEVFNFGLVDTAEKARKAGEFFNAHNGLLSVFWASHIS